MNMLIKPEYLHFRRMKIGVRDKNGHEVNVLLSHGGVTVCYLPDVNTESATIGISVCSYLDAYNKKLGRDRSHGLAIISSEKFKLMNRNELIKLAFEIVDNRWRIISKRHGLKYNGCCYEASMPYGEVLILRNKKKFKNDRTNMNVLCDIPIIKS